MVADVAVTMTRQRGDMKAHISAMEKECGKLADAVLKERYVASHCVHHHLQLKLNPLPPAAKPP